MASITRSLFLSSFIFYSSFGIIISDNLKCAFGRPNIKYEREVFIFLLDSEMSLWEKLPWNKVTTIALFMDPKPELICLAHSKNVRVVKGTNYPVEKLTNETARREWIQSNIEYAKNHNLDGINLDFETEIDKNRTDLRNGLSALVNETVNAFHAKINGSQVTYDVAWSPSGIDKRFYDYKSIAQSADYIFIMSYDEQSQIFDEQCTARANSPFEKTLGGVLEYFKLGVPSNKMILGLPWYGYRYPCLKLLKNNTCMIEKVAFRGSPCSDAAGSEVPYNDILKIFSESATSARLWDHSSMSPYFNFKINGTVGQFRYDDPVSLKLKYAIALKLNLKGVGMWTANFLDYSNSEHGRKQREQMWQAIPFNH